MKLFNFYIFNRYGDCLYYREWDRPQNTLHDDLDEERKLVFGMLFSLKDLCEKIQPVEPNEMSLQVVKTNSFCLHHYESTTGLMFVLNSDCDTDSQYMRLEHIYKNIYIEYVTLNPLYHRNKRNDVIKSELFNNKLDEYLFTTTKTPHANVFAK
jgi:trafficking protein particle complex subunit 1